MRSQNQRQQDPWCRYLPALHRQLASPAIGSELPRSFVSLNFEDTCAWWETLRYLFRSLLGWRCIPAGLAWWYEAGKPELSDPRLKLVLERWNTREELDYFAAREWKTGGITGSGEPEQAWPVSDYELEPGWWRELERRGPLAEHDPYHGGTNPLHLCHSDPVGLAKPPEASIASQASQDPQKRRAVLVAASFGSWRRELEDFGKTLPDLGDRSWHVEVFDREVGYLGKFRQSRVTGLWFQGKHTVHIAGNVEEG